MLTHPVRDPSFAPYPSRGRWQSLKRMTAILALATGFSASFASAPYANAQDVMGITPVDDIQSSGSDAASQDFNANVLPGLLEIVNANLSERASIGDISAYSIRPEDLRLSVDGTMRAYFIGEGAGYRNTFGFYTGDSSDALTGDAQLIFPDASAGYSYLGRTIGGEVVTGDFVDLGEFEADTQVNLFLVANGANGGTQTFFTDSSLNSDGIDHFILLATPESSYLLIGIEDLLGGGDEDYNDLVVALEIGVQNVNALISNVVPLPAPVFALLALLGIGLIGRSRQKSGNHQPHTHHQAHTDHKDSLNSLSQEQGSCLPAT